MLAIRTDFHKSPKSQTLQELMTFCSQISHIDESIRISFHPFAMSSSPPKILIWRNDSRKQPYYWGNSQGLTKITNKKSCSNWQLPQVCICQDLISNLFAILWRITKPFSFKGLFPVYACRNRAQGVAVPSLQLAWPLPTSVSIGSYRDITSLFEPLATLQKSLMYMAGTALLVLHINS